MNVTLPRREDEDDVELLLTPADKFQRHRLTIVYFLRGTAGRGERKRRGGKERGRTRGGPVRGLEKIINTDTMCFYVFTITTVLV